MTFVYAPKTKMYAHQQDGVNFLVKHRGVGALLWEPGCGKTKAIIDYLGVEALLTAKQQTWIIVAPKGAVNTWKQEFAIHAPYPYELVDISQGSVVERIKRFGAPGFTPKGEGVEDAKVRIVLVNIDTFNPPRARKGVKVTWPGTASVYYDDKLVALIAKAKYDGIIVDESHTIKGPSTRQRTFAKLSSKVPKRIILTGTAVANSPLDAWGQWQFLNPSRFAIDHRPCSFTKFKCKYTSQVPIARDRTIVTGFRNLEDLRDRLGMDAFVLTKDEALDLPPVSNVIVPVELSDTEQKHYTEMSEELLTTLTDGSTSSASIALVKMMRLRQVTSGFLKDIQDRTHDIGSAKLDVLLEGLEELLIEDEKVVVFADFIHDVERITKACEKKKWSTWWVTGSVTGEARTERLQEFKHHSGGGVIVCQTRTMSMSVNELVVSSNAFYYSLSPSRTEWLQSRGRLDRSGQTKPVTFRILTVPDSIDTLLLKMMDEKASIEELLLDLDALTKYLH